nr:zinc-binding dehydrogenase [Chloroflexota bacterium]
GVTSIAATDPLEHRRRAAAEGGATAVTASDAPADVDVAFDASGEPGAVAAAVGAVRPAGRVVLVGIPGADVTAFPAAIARRKELTLVVCRRMTADDMPRAIALVADGRIRLDGLVSGRFTLADAPAAFAALAERRGLKIVVGPGAAA